MRGYAVGPLKLRRHPVERDHDEDGNQCGNRERILNAYIHANSGFRLPREDGRYCFCLRFTPFLVKIQHIIAFEEILYQNRNN